ncbi:MAG: YecA family protein [Solirubrobacterales bacterium]
MSQDFKEQFGQQIGFIETSASACDGGNEPEAKRLAVNLRVLLHDTKNSTSLLEHMAVKDLLPFRNTAGDPPPPGALMMFDGGLCSIRASIGEGGGKSRFAPILDTDPERNSQPWQCFEDRWRAPILRDQEGNSFSRYDFVHAVANKDGGAHVDAKLGAAYEALTRGNSMRLTQEKGVGEDGWEVLMAGVVGGPPDEDAEPILNSIALASTRQIAFEVLDSASAISWVSGSATVADPICQLPLVGEDFARLATGLGRNDPCPCGSGRKFKRCLLGKKPGISRWEGFPPPVQGPT